MKTDALESLRAELRALEAKINALAQERKAADVEPPMLDEGRMDALREGTASVVTDKMAHARLRWCEAELARLREGLKVQKGDDDLNDENIECWAQGANGLDYLAMRRAVAFAREIARHRALLK